MSAVAQKSFSGGELSPSLYARTDVAKYLTGLRTCRNMMVMRHGGVTNRPGTKFIGEIKDSTKAARLIPFVFSSDQTYVLEFGDEIMRVIRNGAYVTATAQNITGISNASTAVLTYDGADTYANGDQVYISGVVGAIAPFVNGRTFRVAGVDTGANTFQLNYLDGTAVNSTSWGTWSSGGTVAEVYQIATPYQDTELADLQFVQSADVITLVHPTYAPRELARTGHAAWTLTTITFGPDQAAPTNPAEDGTAPASGIAYGWIIAAVNQDGEESLGALAMSTAPGQFGSASPGSSGTPIHITWTAAASADFYNIYRMSAVTTILGAIAQSGVYGYVGRSELTQFEDTGIVADTDEIAPNESARNPFGSSNNYPSAVAYYQGRIVYANTNNNPETCYASRTGHFKNFEISIPLTDDSAVTWTMAGNQVNEIKHLVELGKLLIFTTSGEWSVDGDAGGIVTPTEVNPRQYSQNGSSSLRPIVAGATVLYVQARGTIVRDLAFDYQSDGYRGNDLTVFSAHLFDQYTIVDWAYQQIPNSIIWAVRSDGTLLGLTYMREHEVLAWHRHDFQDADVENVCCVPESTEDAVYLVIKRTINGATVRYVERMQTRQLSDIEDAIFMDSALTYDGTNAGATTMTLSGGTDWNAYEDLTLTASASYFTAADVGNRIDIESATGAIIRCTITAYTNVTTVTVHVNKDVPANLQSTARTTWTKAVDQVTGLWHLEGESVSVFGDGFVVASPNNKNEAGDASYATVTVANGIATLDKPYGVVQVGLPILADIETLDIDQAQGESLANKQKLINEVTVFTENSRGLWVGGAPPEDDDTNATDGLVELKIRNEENYDDPPSLITDKTRVIIESGWNSNGRIFLRQVDPIPVSILSVVPTGFVPYS